MNYFFEFIYKITGISAFIIAAVTLYYSFLKPSQIDFKIGKRTGLIWHDNPWGLAPMIDVSCTFLNNGAKAETIEKVEIELWKNENKITIFKDWLFLKMINYAHPKEVKNEGGQDIVLWFYNSAWSQEEYSHPIVVNKYSETTKMISFKNEDLRFEFTEGEYIIVIKASSKDRILSEDRAKFKLTNKEIEDIQNKKRRRSNETTEVELKEII